MDFYGIYTPVITPHHEDGSIDEAGFAEVIEHLIHEGVHGIIIAGTTGEYYAQTMEERMRLLSLGVEIIKGRVPVIGGTGAMRTEDSILLAKAAKSAGADALLIATPPYSVPTGRENALHALAVERAVDMPVMLYNYPGRMAAEMDEEFLDRVGQSPNFKAIKESSGATLIVCICWHANIHISACHVAWMIKRSNFLHGARVLGCVQRLILQQRRILRSGRLVLSRVISQKGVPL